MKRIRVYGCLAGCLCFAPALQANTVLTLNPPNGAISGAAGTTIGWGFTFANDTNYAVITGTEFCATASGPLPNICLPPSPDLGTYTDFAGAQFLVVGPSPETTSVTQAFDNSLQTGLGSFSINPAATGTESGILVVTYDLYSVSPNDPAFSFVDDFVGGNYLTAAASVTVGTTSPVPEPSTFVYLAAALLFAVLRVRESLAQYARSYFVAGK
jgi:hypothetical protein